jgi:hypothetical protein
LEFNVALIEDDSFQALENYFVCCLVPVLNVFFSELTERCVSRGLNKIFFISREGEFLSKAFAAFAKARSITASSECLVASRTLLTKINLDKLSADYLRGIAFEGTAYEFFDKRLGLQLCSSEEHLLGGRLLHSRLDLPEDAMRLAQLIRRYVSCNERSLDERKQAYLAYLKAIGYFDSTPFVADVGYSGSLQKLLADITQEANIGYYIIGANALTVDHTGLSNELGALFPQQGTFGDGNPLLDSTLLFEALLSAPYGQCEEVVLISAAPGYKFLFGPKGRSQYAFPILAHGQSKVIDTLVSFAKVPLSYLRSDENKRLVQAMLTSLLRHREIAPKLVQKISEIDDRASGMGFVQPWDFLPPLSRR